MWAKAHGECLVGREDCKNGKGKGYGKKEKSKEGE